MIWPRFEEYALMRMRQRNITEQEVREALEAPRSQHWFNRKHGRMNVKRTVPISRRTIIVSYEEPGDEVVVVNVMVDR